MSVFRSVVLLLAVPTFLPAGELDRAIALYRRLDFANAEAELRRILSDAPSNADARLLLTRTLLAQERIHDALAELDTALASSKDPETRFQAGEIARDLADRRFLDLQAAAPQSAALMELEGRHLEMKGRFAEALVAYQAAAKLSPSRPGIHYWIGNVFWRMRQMDDAKKELRKELESSPHHAMANLRLGQTYLALDDAQSAIPALELALQAMPSSVEANKDLGRAYAKLSRTADARRVWEAVEKARPGDDQIHYLLGNLYRDLGEAELARKEFERHREILQTRRKLAERK